MLEFVGVLLSILMVLMILSSGGGIILAVLAAIGITKGMKALSRRIDTTKLLNGRGTWQGVRMPRKIPSEDMGEPERQTGDSRRQAQARPQAQARSQAQTQARPQAQARATRSAYQAQKARPAYVRFDVGQGVDEGKLRSVMHAYEQTPVVGAYARNVLTSLDARAFRAQSLLPEIDARFSPHSLSWEKFYTSATAALDAVLRNCTLLANHVQSFDVTEYCNYELFQEQGGFATTPDPGQDRLERWRLVFDMRQEMDSLRASNERLLTELGKLASELNHLDSDKTAEDNSDIVEDISRLVEETKYYR